MEKVSEKQKCLVFVGTLLNNNINEWMFSELFNRHTAKDGVLGKMMEWIENR